MAPSSSSRQNSNKRRKTNDFIPISLASSASSPSTSASTSTAPTAGQAMSAVAARRAAALAAPASAIVDTVSRDMDFLEDASSSSSDSSGSESEDEGEDNSAATMYPNGNGKGTVRKQQSKEKSKSAGRYFAGTDDAADAEAQEEDVMLAEEDAIIDEDAEDSTAALELKMKAKVRVKMGRGKRQRREKSAFIDPSCISGFTPLLNSNVVHLSWQDNAWEETGDVARGKGKRKGEDCERRGLLVLMEAGETLVIHGAYTLLPVYGSVSILGAILTAADSTSLTNTSAKSDASQLTLSLPLSLGRDEPHSVFSPSSHPLPPIEALPLPSHRSSQSSQLKKGSSTKPTTLLVNLTTSDSSAATLISPRVIPIPAACVAIVLIADLESGIEGVEKVLRCGGFGGAEGMWDVADRKSASQTLQDSERGDGMEWGGMTWRLIFELTPSLTSLRSLDTWERTLAGFFDIAASSTSASRATAMANKHQSGAQKDMEEQEDAALGEEHEAEEEKLVCIVEGPKRVGKSTFSKVLLNRLLSRYERVAYLDTDLGQPEFTTPGIVSLNVLGRPILGPSFTHPSIPVASHYLGSTSPSSNPSAYMAAILALLNTYSLEIEYPLIDDSSQFRSRQSEGGSRKRKDHVPLIINTQGWVKGLGADLLRQLKDAARASHLFLFEYASVNEYEEGGNAGFNSNGRGGGSGRPWNECGPEEDEDGFDGTESGREVKRCQRINMESAPAGSVLDSKWSAADLRTLNFISYFHSRFSTINNRASSASSARRRDSGPTNSFASRWDFSLPLLAVRPYIIDWRRDPDHTGAESVRMKASERKQQTRSIEAAHLIEGEVEYEQILHAINGMVVALVSSTLPASSSTDGNISIDGEVTSLDGARSSDDFPYSPHASTPPPSSSNCVGLALVRSIDPSHHSLFLLTPLDPATLEKPISLVRGSIELPIALMLDFNALDDEDDPSVRAERGLAGVEWKDVPFLTSTVAGDGNGNGEAGGVGGRKRVRKNLMRRGQ